MKVVALILGGVILTGCTPTVKEVVLGKHREGLRVVKEGRVSFSEEEGRFVRSEAERLGIEVPAREEVERELRRLLRDRKSLEIAFRRANLYIPYIRPIFRELGLPEELSLLPMIESRFNPFAVSRSGAGGIWQLMPQTARRYGLRVDGEVDERFDLIKSTRAAGMYLKDLYREFGRWDLVLAAYNCGEGCVRRRVRGDFWRSRNLLPDQTRDFVPRFFAVLLIARSPEKYGLRISLDSLKLENIVLTETKRVRDLIASKNLKESTFRDLNPHIKGEVIPAGSYVYLPSETSLHPEFGEAKLLILENGAKVYIKD
ncbi:MAG: transglycosylase SLT domain-containing protein [Aquificota bacterium]|nr:transglycosylase SLT domain-containing protein [Aquificota bacterium]